MSLSDELKEFIIFLSIILTIALAFSFMLFGITGARTVFGIVFVSLPFYLMFNKLGIGEGEKFVFSALLGLTIFPALVYLIGLLASFKIAIVATFVLLLGGAIAFIKYKK